MLGSILLDKYRIWEGGTDIDDDIIGVDPGINFGFTIISDNKVFCISGKILPFEHQMERAIRVATVASHLGYTYLNPHYLMDEHTSLTAIEGSAHGKQFRQTQLAEVRLGWYAGIRGFSRQYPIIIPPMTARKLVTGDGRDSVANHFPLMNSNAADSLGIALAAVAKKEEALN